MEINQFKYKNKNYIYITSYSNDSSRTDFCLYSKSTLDKIFSFSIVYGSLCSVKIIQNIMYHSGTYVTTDTRKFRTKHKDLVKEFFKKSLNLNTIRSTSNKLYVTFQNMTKDSGLHLRDELGFVEMGRLPATYIGNVTSNKSDNVNNCMALLALPGNKILSGAHQRTLEILANGENLKKNGTN